MKKNIALLLSIFAVAHIAMAQSNAENLINKMMDEYRQGPASVVRKYGSDDFIFITAEGVLWNKNRTIQSVSSGKLEEVNFTDKTLKTFGNIVVVNGINTSRWIIRGRTINYKDAFTYIYQINGNDIKWLSAQHSLVTPKDRNKAIYRELNQAANERKVDYAKYYAESFEVKGNGKGPKAAEEYSKSFLKTFPDLQIKILDVIAEGDLVLARCEATGTQKGAMNGIPPSGKTGTVAHWTINRFNDEGKIVQSWNLNDNLSMMQQLGIIK